jgi:hypothetical protein
VFSASKSMVGRRHGRHGGRQGVFVMVKWKWSGLHANQERRRERERPTIWIFIIGVCYTAPHKHRDRPRDLAPLGGSPGYQRYQKISRMLRQICESLFLSAWISALLCHEEPWTDMSEKTFSVIFPLFQSFWHK